jgi:hypothetical protein
MNLERTDYDAIFRRDVNSYIAIYEGYYDAMSDKERKKMCKVKGFFKTEAEIGRGLSPLIIPKAIFQYFVHQIPFKETVMGTQDIHDFLAAQKIGRNFEIYWGAEKMQRINRFYVCKPNTGHYLVKKDPKTGKEISLYNE